MKVDDLRKKFLEFFEKKGHKILTPAPLIPQEDSTTLFTSSGMQQLVPYFKGEPHPLGGRLVNSQPCFRAEDIEEVGDNRHTTFFEMLGNWSLGDYFKEKQLTWFYEFLIREIGLEPERLYVSVFEGDKTHKIVANGKSQPVGPDFETIDIWRKLLDAGSIKQGKEGFDPKVKIHTYKASKNWWSRAGTPSQMPIGEIGGPDSEVFYDVGKEHQLHENSPFKNEKCHLNCDCGRFLEIGNSVFMQYEKVAEGVLKPLPNKNVDFGGGLERMAAALDNNPDVFKTDLFWPIIEELEKVSDKKYEGENKALMRVIADHLKGAVFMAQGGLEPSNKRQGYIMRRLIRRSVVKMIKLGMVPHKILPSICQKIISIYGNLYFNKKPYEIHPIIGKEIDSFEKTIHKGTKLLQNREISGKLLFDLYQTYGFPLEISQELLKEWGRPISQREIKEFEKEKEKHQKLSRTASAGMFKGGLADYSKEVTKLHTATHLLHAALRKILGTHIQQVGSNITPQRLRFDFTHQEKLIKGEVKKIESLVNEQIRKNLKVEGKTMSLAEAKKVGALAFFGQKYPDKVKVYFIPSASSGRVFSAEVCGGPHVDFTGRLGSFKIEKQESVGSGKRRIYGRLS